ncbi:MULTISPECIES: hypothetical protein [Thermoactinomyces]|jgi:hypothetical protein|uniref:Uncharacterized protein n=1 Tax=Thermoactinomyces daqus TaxID=1329516 RepID=A0A7W1XCD0_9BACL|nr:MULTISPECIES: hypothetical protein [Thermoactinomyces]MBA4543952.1 hypothetical protein [Thermoactinomyces daqus]MBH8597465.1 hypothetical protein [Thermoactinomyces sp. CICC 10523]MBH8603026.1 hypothetical protein [Thermoactinomyces sp. CICC 10522]MBH8609218.1 hypothetical protein [Thermoactinomyces sp. CICC 10521]
MFRFLNLFRGKGNEEKRTGQAKAGQNPGGQGEKVEEMMNEISKELGVDKQSRSFAGNPNELAEQIKQEIKERT